MEIYNNTQDITPAEFQRQLNKIRLENKNNWYQFGGTVNGKTVKIKAFETWLQIFLVDNLNYSNPMDRKPTEFKADLLKPFLTESNS